MRKNYITTSIIFFLAFSFTATAQTDSLKKLLAASPKDQKSEVLVLLGENYRSIDPDSSIYYGKEAVLQARHTTPALRARSHRSLGISYYYQGEFNKSFECMDSALLFLREIDDEKGMAKCINIQGLIYQQRAEYDSSIRLLEKALSIRKKLGDRKGMAASNLNLGNVYYFKNDFTKTLNYFYKAAALYKELDLQTDMADVFVNIGSVYNQLGDYDKALTYFDRAEKIYKKNDATQTLARVYNNKAEIMNLELKEYDKALSLYNKALTIKKQYNDKAGIALIRHNIGTVYGNMEQYDKAYKEFEASYKMFENLDVPAGLIMAEYNMGKVKQEEGKYADAVIFFRKSLQSAMGHDYREYIGPNQEALFQCYAALNDMKNFDKYYGLYATGIDSLQEQYRQSQIQEVEWEQKANELDRENRQLRRGNERLEKKVHNYRMISWGLGTILAVVFLFIMIVGFRKEP